MSWFHYVARVIARIIFILLTRWQVRGKENIPSRGPLLVVSNHLSLADPPLLSVSFNRTTIFMAKRELFHFRLLAYFMRGFGAFPVRRGQLDKEAIRQAEKVLAEGLALVMFPEGMRSHSGQLRSAFSGAALIAARNRALILPVGINGTERIRGVGWLLRRPRITVNIGCPFYLPPVSGKLTKVELVELTNSIMEHIAGLLPQEYRGNYAGKEVA